MSLAPRKLDVDSDLDLRTRRWSLTFVSIMLRPVEFAIVVAASFFASAIRFDSGVLSEYVFIVLLGASLFALLAHAQGSYHHRRLRNPFGGVSSTLLAWSLSVAAVLLICFMTKTSADYSRIWFGLWWSIGAVCLVLVRFTTFLAVHRVQARGGMRERVLLVGDVGPVAQTLGLLGSFELDVVRTLGIPAHAGGDEVRAVQQSVREICGTQAIDRVLLALPLGDEPAVDRIVREFQFCPVETAILAPPTFLTRALAQGTVPTLPVVETIARRPLNEVDRVLKRVFDVVVGAGILVAAIPILLCIALAIKLDSPGPVMFRQRRSGFGGTSFMVYKFRTMSTDACRSADVRQAVRHDPRVTRVGRLLRRSSMDELPQLLNVLRGEMSLVGPRPHAISHDAAFSCQIESYFSRHRVKPGMTGLAQVKGFRGEIKDAAALQQRIKNDLWYAEHWSLGLDLRILILTLFVLVGKDVY